MIHIFKTLTILKILLHSLSRFWKDNQNALKNAETTKTISRTIIIMIHEALPAILISADKNSSFFQTI